MIDIAAGCSDFFFSCFNCSQFLNNRLGQDSIVNIKAVLTRGNNGSVFSPEISPDLLASLLACRACFNVFLLSSSRQIPQVTTNNEDKAQF